MAGDIGSGGALTTGMIEQFEREAGEREVRAHRAVSEFCPREGLTMASSPTEAATRPSAEWHVETGQEPRWMTAYGISADLIVASRGSRDDAVLRSILETVLIETGRPLLIPSTVARSTPILDKIAIVWKPTREAARAVALAVPFLARAKDIVVLTVDEEEGGGEDDDRLVRALMWHGFPVTAERLISGPPGAVETLLEAARTKAGLLIMGGYGHSRLREWVFGGFTERILAAAPAPQLYLK